MHHTTPEMTDAQLWALLVIAEHDLEYNETWALYQHPNIDRATLTQLQAQGHIKRNSSGLLYATERRTSHPKQCPTLQEANRRYPHAYGPQPGQRPAATPAQRRLLRQLPTAAPFHARQVRLHHTEELNSLQDATLIEPAPGRPGYRRISAAGHLALDTNHNTPSALMRQCIEARVHNGAYWTDERHRAYTDLCRPGTYPAHQWADLVAQGMVTVRRKRDAETHHKYYIEVLDQMLQNICEQAPDRTQGATHD